MEERLGVAIERVEASAYTVPTDEPESDGTLEWDSTTIVVAEVHAGDAVGLGYTYTYEAAAAVISDKLADAVRGTDAGATDKAWHAMSAALRNVGRPGLGFCALSAVDVALWDVKARLRDAPLVELLEPVRDEAAIYGSGGFTSYSLARLRDQLGGWVARGIPRVKLKVSREPDRDPERLDAVREAIGDETELFVDSNGALDRDDAVEWAKRFARDWNVSWFEEPVSSDDLDGLRAVREHAPEGLDVAAGEYCYVPADFRRMLDAKAVDCLQADVTRCGGITGFLRAGTLAERHGLDLSAHCAPAASAAVCCAVPRFRHLEWFHDHLRLEPMLFDGVPEPDGGALRPNRERPGLGLELKRADAKRFAA